MEVSFAEKGATMAEFDPVRDWMFAYDRLGPLERLMEPLNYIDWPEHAGTFSGTATMVGDHAWSAPWAWVEGSGR